MSQQFRKTLRRVESVRIELEPAILAGEGVEAEPGIFLSIRPIGAVDVQLAAAAVASRLRAGADGDEAKARYGLATGADVPSDALAASGADSMLAIELGIRHIVGWEGVTLDGETPAAVTPEAVVLLLSEWSRAGRSYASVFILAATGHSILEPGAKKDSAASPGTSTAVVAKPADGAGS